MIVVDLEMSGLNAYRNGIIAIGAVDILNPENQFYEECRLDEEDKVGCSEEERAVYRVKPVEEIIGLSEEEMRDPKKPSQKETLKRFFDWVNKCKVKILVGQNPVFDYFFLVEKTKKYKLNFPLGHRTFDLHTLASLKHFQVKGKFLIENGVSAMGLRSILKFCGMKDERKNHNALEDARLEAECLSRLLYGKGLLPEYKKFKLPEYLKKK